MGRCTLLVVRLTRRLALVGLWFYGVFAFAGPMLLPTSNPGECCPNAKNYGYFETQWRVWPGDLRPERAFPSAVGREIMPKTPGQVPLPLPKAEAAPPKTEAPAGAQPLPTDQALPETNAPGPKLTPGTEITPLKPEKGEKPAETPLFPENPILENALPGLGPESTAPAKPGGPKSGNQPSPSPGAKSGDLVPAPPSGKKPQPEKEINPAPPAAEKPAAPRAPPGAGAGVETDANSPILRASAAMPFDGGQATAGNQAGQAVLEAPISPAHASPHTAEFCEAASGGEPPLILNGFCVVELTDHQRWTRGDDRWMAVYAGRTFLFSGQEQQLRFLASPARYTPACAGNDPVLAAEQNVKAAGKCEFSTLCDGRVYLFSSAETLARFRQNPSRYVAQGQ